MHTFCQACWVLSCDDALQPWGASTAIDWQNDFNLYLEYLLHGICNCKTSIMNIFHQWAEALFPLSEHCIGCQTNKQDTSTKNVMAELDNDEEEPEDRDQEQQNRG